MSGTAITAAGPGPGAAGPPPGASPHGRRGLGTAWHVAATTTLTATPVFLPGAAADLIDADLGWSTGGLGTVLAVYWLGSLAGAFASRRSRAPLTAERVVLLALLATAAALASAAALPRAGLWAGGTLGGCAYGFSQPYTNSLLMRRCAPTVRGLAFGLKQAAVPAATLLCSVAVPLAAIPLGWRTVFAGGSAVCLGYGLLFAVRGPRGTRPEPAAATPLRWDRRLASLAAAGLLGAVVGNSLGGFLILTLTDAGFTLATAGFVAAGAAGLSVLVRVGAGWLADRDHGHPWRELSVMFLTGAVGTALLALGTRSAGVAGAFLAYAGGWGWAGLLHYIAGVSYPGREKQATAMTQMGVSLGAAVGPFGFGWLTEAWAQRAWWGMAAVGAVAAQCVWGAARTRSR
ncbi:MFS transporter [Streptomyces sp. NPDC093018]|uniref:MFS transporter n=1 Tax=Streptomyces sp. NPDC093018 TaxID=3155067 RepID=UPI00341A98F3